MKKCSFAFLVQYNLCLLMVQGSPVQQFDRKGKGVDHETSAENSLTSKNDLKRIGFTVMKAKTEGLADLPAKLEFEKILTNAGTGWDEKENCFRAPKSGLYVFSWTAVSSNTSHARVTLMKNNEPTAYSWSETKGYQSGGTNIVLELAQGDVIELEVSEGSIFEPSSDRGYATFTGYRIA